MKWTTWCRDRTNASVPSLSLQASNLPIPRPASTLLTTWSGFRQSSTPSSHGRTRVRKRVHPKLKGSLSKGHQKRQSKTTARSGWPNSRKTTQSGIRHVSDTRHCSLHETAALTPFPAESSASTVETYCWCDAATASGWATAMPAAAWSAALRCSEQMPRRRRSSAGPTWPLPTRFAARVRTLGRTSVSSLGACVSTRPSRV